MPRTTSLLTGGSAAVVVGLLCQQSPPQPAAGSDTSIPSTAAASPALATSVALPTRIVIPAIGVDSPVMRLGLAADGTLQVPGRGPDYDKAAWFDGSPVPGQPGRR